MKEKFYSMWGEATDKNGEKHQVTVVGRVLQEKITDTVSNTTTITDERGKEHDALIIADYKKKQRTFTMARSICDPRDTFDFERGKEIAKRRIVNGDTIGSIQSENITMLNDDMCNLLVFNEVNHVIKNIDAYIGITD